MDIDTCINCGNKVAMGEGDYICFEVRDHVSGHPEMVIKDYGPTDMFQTRATCAYWEWE